MRKFGGSLLIAVGLLVLGLGGSCTLSSLPPPFGTARNGAWADAEGTIMLSSIPIMAGATLAAIGVGLLAQDPTSSRIRQALFWLVAGLGFFDTLFFLRPISLEKTGSGVIIDFCLAAVSALIMIAAARAALRARLPRPSKPPQA